MAADNLHSYRFMTDAQWNACVFAQADRDPGRTSEGIGPFAPYERSPHLYESRGAHAPVITQAGEILWTDDDRVLHRLSPCNEDDETSKVPKAIACASRVVSTSNGLWLTIGDPAHSIELFEEDTLTRLLKIDVVDGALVDIASDGRNSVFALITSNSESKAMRFDAGGRVVETIEFSGISDASAFVYLRRSQRFVVLASRRQPRLYWFSKDGGAPVFSRVVAAMRPCFEAHVLGSDGSERVFLEGKDSDHFGGRYYIVTFDADGNWLGDIPLDPLDVPITGITANRKALFVAGRRGLLKFAVAEVVPEGAGNVRTTLITPVLFSPDREDKRRWLRVEAMAKLPEGSSLEIAYASTDKDDERKRLNAIATDESTPASHRVEKLLSEPDLWKASTTFYGSGNEAPEPKKFSAKLFDETDRYIWVSVSLSAAAGARLPRLTKLDVLYPGQTLMENLPAIYQDEEVKKGSFLRSLVGVLETTTQGLDERIGSMGSRINPSTAPEPWLDFIARWLGVPWDDELPLKYKKAIIKGAPELAKTRSTRAGLEALLESLVPGKRRRFRVTDNTADRGFAVVGGTSCDGSTLPAMLGGRTRWHPELDSSAVLNHIRLPCPGQLDDGVWQLTGKVQIDIAATAMERRALEPWLLSLIMDMVPLTARVELRWVTAQSLRTNRLDGSMTLEARPVPHLGTDAITSLARLPRRGTRLSRVGPVVGTRLR
jgi:phage tail-like protein